MVKQNNNNCNNDLMEETIKNKSCILDKTNSTNTNNY